MRYAASAGSASSDSFRPLPASKRAPDNAVAWTDDQTGIARRLRSGAKIDNVGNCEQAINSPWLVGFTVSSAIASTYAAVMRPSVSVVSQWKLDSVSTSIPELRR